VLFSLMLISIYGAQLTGPHIGLLAFMIGWPHLAYWRTRRGSDDRKSESLNSLVDCIIGGALIPAFGFRLWPVAAVYLSGVIHVFVWGGPRYALLAIAVSLVGLVAALPVFGTEIHLETEPLAVALSVVTMFSFAALVGTTAYRLRVRQRQTRAALEAEEKKSTELLLNVFPASIVPRLRAGESPIADQYADVTVIFADIVEFTPLAEQLGPRKTVLLLNDLFRRFDQEASKCGAEKIETTGDGYLAVAGAPELLDDHPQAAARFALGLIRVARETPAGASEHVQIRIGIHTGPVFAGVVGESRFHYKIFGDTVNTASRIQSQARPGRILVSEVSYKRLHPGFSLVEHGIVELKGHGPMKTYWLTD
jgi:class 3 adenylate cyclase